MSVTSRPASFARRDGARVGPQADDDVDAGVLEVERVRVALGAVADDGDGLAVEQREVCVVVVEHGGGTLLRRRPRDPRAGGQRERRRPAAEYSRRPALRAPLRSAASCAALAARRVAASRPEKPDWASHQSAAARYGDREVERLDVVLGEARRLELGGDPLAVGPRELAGRAGRRRLGEPGARPPRAAATLQRVVLRPGPGGERDAPRRARSTRRVSRSALPRGRPSACSPSGTSTPSMAGGLRRRCSSRRRSA